MSERDSPGVEVQGRYFLKCCDQGVYLVYEPPFNLFRFEDGVFFKETTLGYAYGKLLEVLVSSPGTMLAREQIFLVAWPDRVVTPNSLNQAISVLRQLFADTDSRVIKTIPRRGYLFNPEYILDGKDLLAESLNTSMATFLSQGALEQADAVEPKSSPEQVRRPDAPRVSLLETTSETPGKSYWQVMSLRRVLMTLVVLFAGFMVFRLYYIWEEGDWFNTRLSVEGEQSVLYVASDAAEVEQLQTGTDVLQQRFAKLAQGTSFLLVNKMHSYYDIVCLSGKVAPSYILVHEKSLGLISDEQIIECLR